MDYTFFTLGELLSSENKVIKRNAISILKMMQSEKKTDNNSFPSLFCPACGHRQSVEMGINGGDYLNCDNCHKKSNIYFIA